MQATPRVWLIAGPTASGKSALARALAVETGASLVNADALQVYRDLRVLTARPSAAEEAEAPHHLYGVADARDAWSVGRWLRAARPTIDQLVANGRPAIVVGGTGLYFSALTRGLAEVPEVASDIRAACGRRLQDQGEASFRARLAAVDPRAAAAIAPGDRQRLVRALSVHVATGRSLTDWRSVPTSGLPPPVWRGVVLAPARDALYRACDARLTTMLVEGVLEEVARLLALGLDPSLPIAKATGLRDFARHVAGEISLQDALDSARRETRRYAKRQTTWFARQAQAWPRVSGTPEEIIGHARSLLAAPSPTDPGAA